MVCAAVAVKSAQIWNELIRVSVEAVTWQNSPVWGRGPNPSRVFQKEDSYFIEIYSTIILAKYIEHRASLVRQGQTNLLRTVQ